MNKIVKVDRKIYNGWAFTENETLKQEVNNSIYEEIKDKAEVKCIEHRYISNIYTVISNPHNLTKDELALICDRGNLCFGYRMKGSNIVVSTD